MSEATQMTTMKNENVVVYDVMTYVERVECHLEVELHYFQRRVDVLRRNGQEQHVWNAEQRNEHQRRLRQPSAVPAFYTLNYSNNGRSIFHFVAITNICILAGTDSASSAMFFACSVGFCWPKTQASYAAS